MFYSPHAQRSMNPHLSPRALGAYNIALLKECRWLYFGGYKHPTPSGVARTTSCD